MASAVSPALPFAPALSDFRSKTGEFFNDVDGLATKSAAFGIDRFWQMAGIHRVDGSCEFFRKMVNGFCGQGESERMNKKVKKIRNKLRNRQSHEITSAQLILDSHYRREEKFVATAPMSHLETVRQRLHTIAAVEDDIIDEHIAAQEQAAELQGSQAAPVTEVEELDDYEEEVDVAANILEALFRIDLVAETEILPEGMLTDCCEIMKRCICCTHN